jgi:hypothetical protein
MDPARLLSNWYEEPCPGVKRPRSRMRGAISLVPHTFSCVVIKYAKVQPQFFASSSSERIHGFFFYIEVIPTC